MTQAPNKVSTHYKKTQKNGRKPQTQYSIELWRQRVFFGEMDAKVFFWFSKYGVKAADVLLLLE
ncbi:MAG: hypothetical protein BWY22_01032 [Bacteroidetes bacterium ADurb.Bin217]|nr:MAG: hypothetical protein BWY22_01032 [Bacteroidetes bacterium ADurb.Bin217]